MAAITEDELITSGIEAFGRCYSGVIPSPPREMIRGDNFPGFSMKMFHDVWNGIDLPMRDKRLLILGVLAATGGDLGNFEIHIRSALRNKELTPNEARSVILMVLPYVGYPRASPMNVKLEQILAESASE